MDTGAVTTIVPEDWAEWLGVDLAPLRDKPETGIAANGQSFPYYPAPVTIDDGIEALRIALAARRSSETGLPVEVAAVIE